MPQIDWNNVSEEQFTLVPEGTYEAVISTVTECKSSKGDDMWKLKLTISKGDYKDKTILTQLVFNEGGYGNIKKLYSAIFGTKLPNNCETSDILDESVNIDVVHNEYNGKTYANIAYAGFSSVEKSDTEIFG